jgi:hypothetical protein
LIKNEKIEISLQRARFLIVLRKVNNIKLHQKRAAGHRNQPPNITINNTKHKASGSMEAGGQRLSAPCSNLAR